MTRIPSLDGWRGIAILFVLLGHLPYSTGFPAAGLGFLPAAFDPDLGVRIFFVLSGFLITRLLLREADEFGDVSLWRFFARRALRLLPVYLAYLAALAGLQAAGLYADAPSSWLGCLTFTRNMIGRGDSATQHFWSLSVEEQFYLLAACALVGLRLWRRPALAMLLLAVIFLAGPPLRLLAAGWGQGGWHRLVGPWSLAHYADSLAAGGLAAFAVRAWPNVPRRLGIVPCALASLAIIATIIYQPALGVLTPSGQAAALSILILASTAAPFRPLSWPPLVWLGVLSYSIYVWHFLFLSHFMGPRWEAVPTHRWWAWPACALAVAAASYYALERPLLGLRHRFSRLHGV